MLFGDILLV